MRPPRSPPVHSAFMLSPARRRLSAALRRIVILLAVASCAGCTLFTGYERRWDRASHIAPVDLSGAWEGSWHSEQSTHKGCLRAIITRVDDTHFCARFHATFFKFFSYEYTIVLYAVPDNDHWNLSGQKDLGRLAGGMYYYRGVATACNFRACYTSCKDHGVFEMKRSVSACDSRPCK